MTCWVDSTLFRLVKVRLRRPKQNLRMVELRAGGFCFKTAIFVCLGCPSLKLSLRHSMNKIMSTTVSGWPLCPQLRSQSLCCRTQSRWRWSPHQVSDRTCYRTMRVSTMQALTIAVSLVITRNYCSLSHSSTLLCRIAESSVLLAGTFPTPSPTRTLMCAGDNLRSS